jgi:SSS family solute:Na+ symporter
VIIPIKLGGYPAIFEAARHVYEGKVAASGGKVAAGLTLTQGQLGPFITLAIGSAFALWMYPHSMTGVLAASNPKSVRRNAMLLPAYSLILGLIALLGVMAHAAGIVTTDAQSVVPLLFKKMFPEWFYGFSFAAIAIGALVPAAVMSIGAANTFTRNIWRPFIHPGMTPAEETVLSKLMSLIVKIGALAVIFLMPTKFAIDLQLLGGVWMMQVFPAIAFGLYTRRLTGWGLLAGWATGITVGTYLSYTPNAWVPVTKLWDGFAAYNGLTAIILNVVVALVISSVFPSRAADETKASDYEDAVAEA